ncbi:helix-turn-helix domain-containing protein [Sphingomonas sp. FW199]|uniref:helix-turn-helix domain-containing protein n=1 Tax=Sphingomonas sp. FW199 TaxID=3400217 RepID=UPI003CF1C888
MAETPQPDDSRLAIPNLSARERDCLALVADGFTSKEIAAKLGMSPHTVDQRLKAVVRKTGAASRQEAARLFKASQLPQPLGNQLPDIVTLPPEDATWLPQSEEEPSCRLTVEEPAPARFQPTPGMDRPFPLATQGARNDLRASHTLLLIAGLTAALLIGFGVLTTGIEALIAMRARF